MEENAPTGLKRNISFSRRLSVVSGSMVSAKWTRVLFVVVVMCLGILCGNFVYKLAFGNQETNKNFKRMKGQNIHEPPDSRPGLSIKKDLSIQFRDYIPRKIFITTGDWFHQRESLKVFLQTYPEASAYDLYCFVEDKSYNIFFTNFNKTTLLESTEMSSSNKTVRKLVSRFGLKDSYKNITQLDLGSWLIDTFHQDDYIVLRMESVNETAIAKRLGKTGALDWVDKYYTTSRDNETQSVYQEVFSELNIPLLQWDDEDLTYSDFGDLNKIEFEEATSVITQCGYYDQFLLIMFVPYSCSQAKYSLDVLMAFAGPRFLETVIFLPKDFITENRKLTESLIQTLHVGLILENKTYSETPFIYNRMRNDFIEVNKIIKELESRQREIHYVLSLGLDGNTEKTLCDDRYVNVVSNVYNIDYLIPDFVKQNKITLESIKRKHGQILAVDLTKDNSELLMVYLLKKFGPGMVAIKSCEY